MQMHFILSGFFTSLPCAARHCSNTFEPPPPSLPPLLRLLRFSQPPSLPLPSLACVLHLLFLPLPPPPPPPALHYPSRHQRAFILVSHLPPKSVGSSAPIHWQDALAAGGIADRAQRALMDVLRLGKGLPPPPGLGMRAVTGANRRQVNNAGIWFRLLSIFVEDLPQLVVQSVAAANSSGGASTLAVVSISLTAMCVLQPITRF
jgi:hypothetical protein